MITNGEFFYSYLEQENLYTFDHYFGVGQRRADTGDTSPSKRDFAEDGGFLCPSGSFQIQYLQYSHIFITNVIFILLTNINFSCIFFYLEIKYAKPKRGKTATGIWKDIVNIDDYTQTLRMEKCL